MGSFLGSVTGVSLIILKGREWGARIPFGPYLTAGAIISLFWGEEVFHMWLRYLHAG
jgi:leader peptidase (prepilin peptidase)/N-methyltransferase